MIKTILIFCLFFISNTFSKDLECGSVPILFNMASIEHQKKIVLTPDTIEKSIFTLFDILDPHKILLTKNEAAFYIDYFKNNKDTILLTLLKKDCSEYHKIIDVLVNKSDVLSNNINQLADEKFVKKINVLNERLDYLYNDISEVLQEISTLNYEPHLIKKNFLPLKVSNKNLIVLKSLLKSLDPHTDFFTESELKDFMRSSSASMIGLGVIYQEDLEQKHFLVNEIMNDSPLSKNGKISKGDMITHINQLPIDKDNIEKIKHFLDEDDKPISITFKKSNEKENKTEEIVITKDRIALKKVSSKLIGKKNDVLYFEIPSFYNEQDKDGNVISSTFLDLLNQYVMETKVKKTKISGLIIDLRNNSGGLFTEAAMLSSLFISNPLVAMIYDENRKIEEYTQNSSNYFSINEPLIILTNSLSASSSEIFAGVIQSYGRGLIVGDKKTYGKGSIQQTIKVPEFIADGLLKVTINNYFLPNGVSPHNRGIDVDINIPSYYEKMEYGESKLRYSTEIENISSKVYTPIPAKKIEKIRKNSQSRLNHIDYFSYIKSASIQEMTPNKMKELLKDKDPVLDETLNIMDEYLKN